MQLFRPALATALALVGSAGLTGRAQSDHCDPYLKVSQDNPFGYRARGDRCEGVYVQQVANTPLRVASFGVLNLPMSWGPGKSMNIEWSPVASEVRLRTYALTPRTYYQMDSRRPPGASSYAWSTDVLSALQLAPREIGIVAWTGGNIGNRRRDLYIPVRIGSPLASWDRKYELIVVPGSELAELYVGLKTLATGNGIPDVVSAVTPLKYIYYPPGRGIRIPIGPITKAGTYIVEMGATLQGGGAISYELWFVQGSTP